MKYSDAIHANSKYLKTSDLQGKTVQVTIQQTQMEEVGQGQEKQKKLVMYFVGKAKGMVLNSTNGDVLLAAFGDETDNWAGRAIEIRPDTTRFQGQVVPCMRISVAGEMAASAPAPSEAAPPAPAPAAPPALELSDDIPF